jgi:hypothetical protein
VVSRKVSEQTVTWELAGRTEQHPNECTGDPETADAPLAVILLRTRVVGDRRTEECASLKADRDQPDGLGGAHRNRSCE